ncbi:aldehyde dehydrogenase [Mycobacterium saskatchewanense]|uniref:Aldehyde dehydrogenase n=1 Tax=Mycobacterium saskatchewanense TaxID=220927 RepID=A0AAJ3TVC2_9MYCO|nr:aldehyde dehydrogenase family protein [Mycobacterium saskatchewanense]ORW68115.1 aldehyde dehydrogenase [Mycobacterium saskatchewanense]BBX66427.1 aldehyde dehydrogenase [Mycobacterium saskatchewanense]
MTRTAARPQSYSLYINGRWVEGAATDPLVVLNPATGEPIAEVPNGTVADAQLAIQAARRAFDDGPWPRWSPRQRSTVLSRMAQRLRARYDDLVDLSIVEAGSTRTLAPSFQVGIPIERFTDVVERVLPRFDFETALLPLVTDSLGQGVVLREPAGVASLITAYNFPLFLNLSKIAPALAAGCTAVLKPSPYTPLEALILGEIAAEADLPEGVLNIVTGATDASHELTVNPMVDIVSFTGSVEVGRYVNRQAADTFKRVVLELGGKSANIICPDADLDRAAIDVVAGMTIHAGQGCSLLTRTLVHHSRHDELVERVTRTLGQLTVGDPADCATDMGPLIREAQRTKVEAMIARARDEGAEVAYGGGRPAHLDKGFYVEPTLLVNVDNRMNIARQEVFGPVGIVIPFDDDDHAVRLANDSDFGLGGGVWSADPVRAYTIARRLRTGTVSVNGGGGALHPDAPFGGYKHSGLGREWGGHGIAEFLEDKAVTWPVAGG